MIGLLIITHGNLALEFRLALEHIVGEQRQLATLAIGANDDIKTSKQKLLQAVKNVDSGEGAILLTDMFGGTPANLAISIMDEGNYQVIAGVNLPLLIKISALRETETMSEIIEKSIIAGKNYINVAKQIIEEN